MNATILKKEQLIPYLQMVGIGLGLLALLLVFFLGQMSFAAETDDQNQTFCFTREIERSNLEGDCGLPGQDQHRFDEKTDGDPRR